MQNINKSNFEVLSLNRCAVEKQYVSRSCPAGKAHSPCYFVICDLSGSTIFFHIVT